MLRKADRTNVPCAFTLSELLVVLVKYNEGREDRFIHRYEYDEDNRIQEPLHF